jgi:AmmeMemoRadiSam system radical SAM enzyme
VAEGSIIDTDYWHVLEDGRVQCDVCPRACKLRDGQRGLCFVRGAEAGRIKLFSYGRSSGFCVDPIEKKPLNHFLPGTSVLSFGTAGCNLACKFCQNWTCRSRAKWTLLPMSRVPKISPMPPKGSAARASRSHTTIQSCSALGFVRDTNSDVICRWRHTASGVLFDLMPIDPAIFTGRS